MHADTQAHEECDQHHPAQGVGRIGPVVPHGHGPEHHGRKERRHCVNLALDCGEPESIGEAICQGAHEARTYDGKRTSGGFGANHPLGEPDYGQIQEEYGKRRTDGAHGVDQDGGVHIVAEHREEAGDELEYGVSRGMPHLQFIGRGDELAAVPERSRGLYGEQVCDGGNDESSQGRYPVPKIEFLIVHTNVSNQSSKIVIILL